MREWDDDGDGDVNAEEPTGVSQRKTRWMWRHKRPSRRPSAAVYGSTVRSGPMPSVIDVRAREGVWGRN